MGPVSSQKRKKICGYLEDEKPRWSSAYTEDFPAHHSIALPRPVERPPIKVIKVIHYPPGLFKENPKPRSSLPSTIMEQPRSSLLATNTEKPSKMKAFIKYKKLLRIRQTRADKQYKKSHQGNGWKKPLAGSLHPKDFTVHDEMCIQVNQPISATPDSGSGPSNTVSSVSSVEEITKRVDLLTKKLALDFSPKQDVTFHTLDWNYFFCWVSGSSFLDPPYKQLAGECWRIALARGYEYYVAVNKIVGRKHLTFSELRDGVSAKHLTNTGGIENMEDARKFMVDNGFVKDMVVHRRPSDDIEGFERLMDLLIARGPVVVVMDCLPSYRDYDGKSVFIPNDKECQAARFECFYHHSVVVTGCGVKESRGEVIEYWRTQDSQGADFGVEGFTALARHKGIITAAVEFKF